MLTVSLAGLSLVSKVGASTSKGREAVPLDDSGIPPQPGKAANKYLSDTLISPRGFDQ